MNDLVKKYLFQDRSIRVQTVNLTDTWRDARAHQQHPPVVQQLLGELCAAAVLLAANLKFDGSLLLQLQGDGPIALLVVECDSQLNVRATVKLRQEFAICDNATFQELINPNRSGRFIVVLDLADRQPGQQAYQGIVALEGDSVAEVLEDYMRSSEQLDTCIRLAADEHKCTGLLVQRLPNTGGVAIDAEQATDNWEQVGHYMRTVEPSEQLALSEEALVHRLFWEKQLMVAEADLSVRWYCSCSRERVADMLRSLGVAEIESILEERDQIEVICDFCGMPYRFDPIEAAQLFLETSSTSPSPTVH